MLTTPSHISTKRLSYSQRAELCSHPVSRTLFRLMMHKQSNLSISADVRTAKELIQLADALGPHICVLKTHVDIIDDFDWSVIQQLQELSDKHQFLLFEDRKFADIGYTVLSQYEGGLYRIADWAHITNAHSLPGPGLIEGLREIGRPKSRGLLLLAEMSCRGNLLDSEYTKKTVQLAQQYPDFVMGYITQHRVCDNPTSIHFTPGVKLSPGFEALGQQWNTPKTVIAERGADVIIVGRGIYGSTDPVGEAERYRVAGWEAYEAAL